MEAEVAVSIELAAVAKDADFLIVDEYDPPVTVLEFRTFSAVREKAGIEQEQ